MNDPAKCLHGNGPECRKCERIEQGYMDAAAVPVPDAGDDGLREARACACGDPAEHGPHDGPAASDAALHERLVDALHDEWPRVECESIVERLLPLIRDHTTKADSPQRLFGRLISTAKGREILDENGIHGVERAEKAEAAIQRVRALHGPCNDGCPNCHECALAEPCPTIRALDGAETSHGR